MRCKLMHPVQRRRRGSSRTFGSRMPCGQRAGVAPCTFFSCWAKAASSITWSETRVPLGRGARVWVAVHAAGSALCAHRQGVVKRLGRVGHSGILVAQPLDRCDLGADGMSGLHLFVCMGWLLWGLAVKPRRVVKPRRECFAIKGACFFGRGDKYRQFLRESKCELNTTCGAASGQPRMSAAGLQIVPCWHNEATTARARCAAHRDYCNPRIPARSQHRRVRHLA